MILATCMWIVQKEKGVSCYSIHKIRGPCPELHSTEYSIHKRICLYFHKKEMKSTKVQTSPISLNRALRHLPQSTEPRAVLGSKCIMATPAQFVSLSER